MSKRPSKQAVHEMKFPTAPIAKLGMAVQSGGKPFYLTEQERADAQKAIAQIEQLKNSGSYPSDPQKVELLDSMHKMLTMSLEFEGKAFSVEIDDDKYRNKL